MKSRPPVELTRGRVSLGREAAAAAAALIYVAGILTGFLVPAFLQ